jgi:ketosteroid isomerase-like protein
MPDRIPGRMAENVLRLFARGEAFDSDGFISFFTEKPVYQFGNWGTCLDRQAIHASVSAFFSAVEALYHDVRNLWEVGDLVFVQMDVTYWRKDGSSVTLPCADIVQFEGDKVQELRIYMDANPIGDKSRPVAKDASVMVVHEGRRVAPPQLMKKFFAEHPEGIERVAQGYIPKWAIAGPRWPIKAKSGIIKAMQAAAFGKDWEAFKRLFADKVYYRVGNHAEATGPQAVAEYVRGLPTEHLRITRMDVRNSWETENAAVIEYDVHGVRLKDNKEVRYPCVDLYRFEGDQFKDWRVYPIEPTFVADRTPIAHRPPAVAPARGPESAAKQMEVLSAFQVALTQGNWESARAFLTDDVVLRIGNRPEVKGPAAVREQLGEVFSRLCPSAATFTEVWGFGDALVVEMTVQATRVPDGRKVEYPCVETYRFADGKIKEWRIYPVEVTLLAPGS